MIKGLIHFNWILILGLIFLLQPLEVSSQNYSTNNSYIINQFSFGKDTIFGAGGISFVDFNNDGWDDLTYATTKGDSILFFINTNGNFAKIPSLVDHTEDARQVLWIDYDNDGDLDFFVATFGGFNRLYENDGNLNFTDITSSVGLGFIPDLSIGASFGDIDNDGDLDLYISNHPYGDFLPYTTNFLYENQNGYFNNITISSGTGDSLKLTFCSAIADFDNDGLQDIYLSNDREVYANVLFKNQGDNTFLDIASASDASVMISSMNTGIADYDYDGDLDIYLTDTDINIMLKNDGNGHFTDIAPALNLTHNSVSWGGSFLDIDNDMNLDLFVSSGSIFSDQGDTSFYYINNGIGYDKIPLPIGDQMNSFANAYGDMDNDGLLEVAVSAHKPDKFVLWKNISQIVDDNWVKIKLQGTTSNSQGIGSWVEVFSEGTYMNRYKLCGESFLAQHSNNLHFGLAGNNIIDSVKVKWLSGIVDTYYNLDINQTHLLTEGETQIPNSSFIANNHENILKIFPNPSRSLSFELSTDGSKSFEYQLLNSQGELIIKGNKQIVGINHHYTLDTKNLNDGIYYLQIILEDGNIRTKKWLVKN